MEKSSKELEVLEKKKSHLATTITKEDIYGPLTQNDSEEIFRKINNNFLREKEVLESYELMNKRNVNYVNLAHLSDIYVFPDEIPHCIGELVLRENKGLVSRFYDSDFGTSFETNLTPTHLKIFGIDYTEILSRVKKWNKTGKHEKDYTCGSSVSFWN